MIIKWFKEKFMDEATRIKLSGFQWYTDGVVDVRVEKDKIEDFVKNNPNHRRGRTNGIFKKKEDKMEQKPYDYEQELAEQGLAPSWVEAGKETAAPAPTPIQTSMLTGQQQLAKQQLKLYLVEGAVQMRPNQAGRQPIQADQRRIVWATSGNEAVQKFSTYFSSLNSAAETYVVIGAAVSEEIR